MKINYGYKKSLDAGEIDASLLEGRFSFLCLCWLLSGKARPAVWRSIPSSCLLHMTSLTFKTPSDLNVVGLRASRYFQGTFFLLFSEFVRSRQH